MWHAAVAQCPGSCIQADTLLCGCAVQACCHPRASPFLHAVSQASGATSKAATCWLSAEHVTEVTQAQLQPGRGTQRPGHVHSICAAAHLMAGHMCAYQATVAYGAAVILWVLRS